MEIRIENGELKYLTPKPLSKLKRAEIIERINNQFMEKVESTKKQPVAMPVLCFSCLQAVVEFKNQACPNCVKKIEQEKFNTFRVKPSLIFAAVLAVITLLFMAWSVFSK